MHMGRPTHCASPPGSTRGRYTFELVKPEDDDLAWNGTQATYAPQKKYPVITSP